MFTANWNPGGLASKPTLITYYPDVFVFPGLSRSLFLGKVTLHSVRVLRGALSSCPLTLQGPGRPCLLSQTQGLCLRTKCHMLPRLAVGFLNLFQHLWKDFSTMAIHILIFYVFHPAFLCAVERRWTSPCQLNPSQEPCSLCIRLSKQEEQHTYTMFPDLTNLFSKIRRVHF